MAIEILKREKYSEKVDIWSLGAIIYQMIYGKNLYSIEICLLKNEIIWH